MEILNDWLHEGIQVKLILTGIAIAFVLVIQYLISRLVFDNIRSPASRYKWQKALTIGRSFYNLAKTL